MSTLNQIVGNLSQRLAKQFPVNTSASDSLASAIGRAARASGNIFETPTQKTHKQVEKIGFKTTSQLSLEEKVSLPVYPFQSTEKKELIKTVLHDIQKSSDPSSFAQLFENLNDGNGAKCLELLNDFFNNLATKEERISAIYEIVKNLRQ